MSKLMSHYCPLASPTTFTSKQKHQPSTVKELEFIMWGVWQHILHLISNHTVIHIEWLYIYIWNTKRHFRAGLGNGVSESLLKLEDDGKKEHSVKVNKPHTKSITHNHFQENYGKENYQGNYCCQPGFLALLNQEKLTGDQTRNSGQTLKQVGWEQTTGSPLAHWLKVGRGSLLLLWVRVGVSRAWPEGVGLVFCLPFCCCERGGTLSTLLLLPLPMLLLALQKWRRVCFLGFFFSWFFCSFCPEFAPSEHAVIFS